MIYHAEKREFHILNDTNLALIESISNKNSTLEICSNIIQIGSRLFFSFLGLIVEYDMITHT